MPVNVPQSGVRAGTVAWHAASSAPSGWLPCNGAQVSRSLYAALFQAIGTTYGVGDGSTTFNVPDLRGEFIRGLDSGRGVDPSRTIGSFQGNQNQSHAHTITDPGHSHTTGGGFSGAGGNATVAGPSGLIYATLSSTTGITVNADGGTEARPRNIAMLPCIKF